MERRPPPEPLEVVDRAMYVSSWILKVGALLNDPAPSSLRRPVLTAEQIKERLHLKPLPREGGFYAETYCAALDLPVDALPPAYAGSRSASTAIFYLLTPDTFSALHRLPGDEVYHFYLGDPVDLLLLHPDGPAETRVLGPDLLAGMLLQTVVPGGTWQGSRLAEGGRWALLGTTMAPGFDVADFEAGDRVTLINQYPECSAMITALTRPQD